MTSKVIFAAALVALAIAIQALPQGLPDLRHLQGIPELRHLLSFDCPPKNPFCPIWVPCNFTEVQGSTCGDCHTRIICTPIGGLVRRCVSPWRRNCVEGRCVREPSEDCAAPPPEPPTEPTEGPATEEPATEGPATEAPATEPPATEPPATEAPATEGPATEAPATEAPATEAPATEEPATEEPQSPEGQQPA